MSESQVCALVIMLIIGMFVMMVAAMEKIKQLHIVAAVFYIPPVFFLILKGILG